MNTSTSRRNFLKGAAATGAVLMVGVTPKGVLAAGHAGLASLTPFVKIDEAGTVTAVLKHFDMGQGASTGLATLIAEELGISLDEIEIEFAPHNPQVYNNLFFGPVQGTGGSTAIANSFMQYRQAGAAAREMIKAAAANAWGVAASELAIVDGVVTGAGQSAPMAEFVAAAADLAVPEDPSLTDPKDFRLIGNPTTHRKDNAPKITGQAQYAMDVHLDGQVVAVIKRPPKFGATVVSFDASAAEGMPGYKGAAALPTGGGVVVYADTTWQAFQAREELTVEWDFTNAETRSSDQIRDDMLAMVNSEPEFVARADEGTDAAMAGAAQVIEKEFYFPYLAHASMEVLNCTIRPDEDGGVTLFDGCQVPTLSAGALAQVLQMPMEKVRVETLWAGGSFGRRATSEVDYNVEAGLAFLLDGGQRPVKLMWSREDDTTGGYYRPAAAHKVRVGLDANGRIVAWQHQLATPSIFKGTFFAATQVVDGVDRSSVEGVPDTLYDIPKMTMGVSDFQSPITVAWLRSVGHNHTGYVMETMMDLAAEAAGVDPLEYRLSYLSGEGEERARMREAFQLAADTAGWGTPLPDGHARGIAGMFCFNTAVAQVAEVSKDEDGYVQIEKFSAGVDVGLAVNPDVVEAQVQGGIGFALGFIMRDGIGFDEGEVIQSNFHDYEPLRVWDIKDIEVAIVPSAAPPSGIAEPPVPPAGPALANAIAALGTRVTMLPMAENGVDFV
ncbi:Isoquinoline 1-oxidoreductase beta subunit [Candidatus Rhodobacter oscarellae]|uniref:Isoquinoline 1-oxidoreductase beta subunit n=1 Tax=Candidatus Rhodobacter oscarellae TaxID=1675527 RepID=A0A0J9EBC6_9RHOB|nr:molybdopterin cofactor-binding domain-containing protein [Candidatus Rhodobacter lobularis]KMW60085.1 Isoquinoline 1-oxidoreductase beta subunit [Candidatus Rhodobacter lobularis]